MSKEITMEQVARQRYSKRSPYWIVIHNDVYDVTNFLNEHPGGVEALTDYAGKDATKAFEDVGHSEDAREMMRKYKIGHVPAAQRNTYFDPW
ncbi:cytochrome b5-like [Hyposmocoma kahamanoa]|uniref:cytochrome b5-like n=1 Tax=Hyposmocoma kahamanoa TaxID=1477025 RepID=UPI000E6D95B9|nr:cytochrome b5-like [Hyposmocoma kahamanoa]